MTSESSAQEPRRDSVPKPTTVGVADYMRGSSGRVHGRRAGRRCDRVNPPLWEPHGPLEEEEGKPRAAPSPTLSPHSPQLPVRELGGSPERHDPWTSEWLQSSCSGPPRPPPGAAARQRSLRGSRPGLAGRSRTAPRGGARPRGCAPHRRLLSEQIAAAERVIAALVVDDQRVRRLLTIPGIGLVTAASIIAAVGDVSRFARPAKLVSYLGLDPRVRQSGDRPPLRGRISRAGQAHARGLLCEAAHAAVRSPGPLAGFHHRLRARRGAGVAIVATARKLAVLVWHLLTQGRGLPLRPAGPDGLQATQPRPSGGAGADAAVATGRATGSSHDRGRAGLRGGTDPHEPALRQAIGHVQSDHTLRLGT